MVDLDSAWDDFLQDEEEDNNMEYIPDYLSYENESSDNKTDVPKCSDIYISTKTKIAYLNKNVDLVDIFWNIKTILYHEAREGVIKKQMKFIFV